MHLEWKTAFQLSSKDKSGSISWVELGNLCKLAGQPATESELKLMVRKADTNGDGLINFEEFLTVMIGRLEAKWKVQEDELLQAFRIFDKDGNGFITHEELKDAMHTSGYMLNDEELSCMIKRADSDGDGQINFKGQQQSLYL
jgi:calmodulin